MNAKTQTALSFTSAPSSDPATPERIAEIHQNPGFGNYFTDHMVSIEWTADAAGTTRA